MGNLCAGGNEGSNDDEENNIAMSLSEAASTGAREGLMEGFQNHRPVVQGQQIAPKAVLIGGLLPLLLAQEAAAAGAKRALDIRAQEFDFAKRFAVGLKQVKIAAGSGAKAGLEELDRMLVQTDIEEPAMKNIDLEVAAAAAAIGARVACYISTQKTLTTSSDASRYTTFLGPMLGGSFPTSVAVYNSLNNSSDLVKLCGFGGITLAVFVISSGLAAGLLGRTAKSACYTRFATLLAVTIVLTLFTWALCTLFSSGIYKAVCGSICGVLILIFVIVWLLCKWQLVTGRQALCGSSFGCLIGLLLS